MLASQMGRFWWDWRRESWDQWRERRWRRTTRWCYYYKKDLKHLPGNSPLLSNSISLCWRLIKASFSTKSLLWHSIISKWIKLRLSASVCTLYLLDDWQFTFSSPTTTVVPSDWVPHSCATPIVNIWVSFTWKHLERRPCEVDLPQDLGLGVEHSSESCQKLQVIFASCRLDMKDDLAVGLLWKYLKISEEMKYLSYPSI